MTNDGSYSTYVYNEFANTVRRCGGGGNYYKQYVMGTAQIACRVTMEGFETANFFFFFFFFSFLFVIS